MPPPAAPSILHAKAFWAKPKNRLKAMKAPVRSTRRPTGGWIHDLVGLGKALNLCKDCQPKFNAGAVGYYMYQEKSGLDHCFADCDGCKEPWTKCNTFLPTKLKTNLRG